MELFSRKEQRFFLFVTACALAVSAVSLLVPVDDLRPGHPKTAGRKGLSADAREDGLRYRRYRPSAPGPGVIGGGRRALPSRPVNPNFAGFDELASVPGIGPALAGRILAYREENIIFSEADMLKIKGIGRKNWKKMAPYFTFSTGDGPASDNAARSVPARGPLKGAR